MPAASSKSAAAQAPNPGGLTAVGLQASGPVVVANDTLKPPPAGPLLGSVAMQKMLHKAWQASHGQVAQVMALKPVARLIVDQGCAFAGHALTIGAASDAFPLWAGAIDDGQGDIKVGIWSTLLLNGKVEPYTGDKTLAELVTYAQSGHAAGEDFNKRKADDARQ